MATRPLGSGSGVKGKQAHKRPPWSSAQEDELIGWRTQSPPLTLTECAKRSGRPFSSVENMVSRLIKQGRLPRVPASVRTVEPSLVAMPLLGDERTITQTDTSLSVEAKVPRLITTEAEAVALSDVDLTRWEPSWMQIRHYPIPLGDGKIAQGSYVKLTFRRKTGASPEQIIDAIERGLDAVVRCRRPPAMIRTMRPVLLRQRIISDLHIGGHAWAKSTGGENWNLERARDLAFASNRYLDERMFPDTTETGIAFLGDLCHYDTPKGNTTGGTQLDLDSRADLMLQVATEYMIATIEEEAERRRVYVNIIEGNHDAMLTKALRRTALLYFRKHPNVTVAEEYTKRQWRLWGANLLGFTHGETRKKALPENMPFETRALWSQAKHCEIHTGHLHHEDEEQKLHRSESRTHKGAMTHGGVIVRTHLALTPTDQYHSDENWQSSQRGMSDWYYHAEGAMVGSRIANARVVMGAIKAAA